MQKPNPLEGKPAVWSACGGWMGKAFWQPIGNDVGRKATGLTRGALRATLAGLHGKPQETAGRKATGLMRGAIRAMLAGLHGKPRETAGRKATGLMRGAICAMLAGLQPQTMGNHGTQSYFGA